MSFKNQAMALLVGALAQVAPVVGQSVSALPEVVLLPKGSVLGVQVTCADCDVAELSITAATDDSNYATVQSPTPIEALGDPFVTIVNVKGESQGGTILRISLYQGGSDDPLSEDTVTIQVVEEIDDDCIFDDLTRFDSDRESLLGVYRGYRDEVLSATPRGIDYVEAYYRHGAELIDIVRGDRELRIDVLRMMHDYRTDIESILSGKSVTLSHRDLAEVREVLARVNAQASPQLQRTLHQIRLELSGGKALAQFGVNVGRHR